MRSHGCSRAPMHALRNRCGGITSSCTAMYTSARTYFWPYAEDFVPKGSTTSSFQASCVPSVRERVVREYAFAPLFGARSPCCVLGLDESPRVVIGRKADIRGAMAEALGASSADDIQLGPLRLMKEMMLHRSGTDESPRLADELGCRPDAEHRRRTQYARLPVKARTLVEVFLDDDVSASDAQRAGRSMQEQLSLHAPSMASSSSPSSSTELVPLSSMESRAISERLRELGVVHLEVPALDRSGFTFEQLHGQPITPEEAERILDRWSRRLSQLHMMAKHVKTGTDTD